ncbi:MAG: helix-turn-helix transcriptional regulator [Candidatus Korobacteraceae bacterium]|jgi:transcriptional regulator with XRE-family HTH domain
MPRVDAERLRYEMAARGLLGRDLARLANLDANTISRALGGKPVTTRTLMRITSGLLTQPQLKLVTDIIVKPSPRRSDVEKFE